MWKRNRELNKKKKKCFFGDGREEIYFFLYCNSNLKLEAECVVEKTWALHYQKLIGVVTNFMYVSFSSSIKGG